jgi:hypothetical protein
MGYYSTVKVYTEEKAYKEIKEIIDSYDYNKPNNIQFVACATPHYIITWEDRKWYFNDCVDAIEKKLEEIIHKEEIGYAVKQIIIGEDNAVEEKSNELGFNTFCDYYTITTVTEPTGKVTNIEV